MSSLKKPTQFFNQSEILYTNENADFGFVVVWILVNGTSVEIP
jgi:hypothetical protein